MDAGTAERLASLAAERERERGLLSLGDVLGRLGAAVTVLGIILLIAANWEDIGDWLKIGGFLLLLGGLHAAGFWIQWSGRPYARFADALHFIGAGLFLAGLALVGQVYHLPPNTARALLTWLLAIAPLAVLLRSTPITGLAIFAAWLWLQFQAGDETSSLHVEGLTSYLMLSMGMGMALVGAQSVLSPEQGRFRFVFRGAGQAMLFIGLFALGFFRHFTNEAPQVVFSRGSMILPLGMLLLGAAGVALGWKGLAPEVPWLRRRLATLLLVLVATCLAAFLADLRIIPRGPGFEFFSFGSVNRVFHLAEIVISAAAWVVWFLLALWCVAYGTMARQKNYVNVGVLAFGLGIITRFIDLIGGLAETGTLFLLGGIVLLGTAWAMERWRRTLMGRMEQPA